MMIDDEPKWRVADPADGNAQELPIRGAWVWDAGGTASRWSDDAFSEETVAPSGLRGLAKPRDAGAGVLKWHECSRW